MNFDSRSDANANNERTDVGRDLAADDGAQNKDFTEDVEYAAQYVMEGVEVDEDAVAAEEVPIGSGEICLHRILPGIVSSGMIYQVWMT